MTDVPPYLLVFSSSFLPLVCTWCDRLARLPAARSLSNRRTARALLAIAGTELPTARPAATMTTGPTGRTRARTDRERVRVHGEEREQRKDRERRTIDRRVSRVYLSCSSPNAPSSCAGVRFRAVRGARVCSHSGTSWPPAVFPSSPLASSHVSPVVYRVVVARWWRRVVSGVESVQSRAESAQRPDFDLFLRLLLLHRTHHRITRHRWYHERRQCRGGVCQLDE